MQAADVWLHWAPETLSGAVIWSQYKITAWIYEKAAKKGLSQMKNTYKIGERRRNFSHPAHTNKHFKFAKPDQQVKKSHKMCLTPVLWK